MFIRYRIYAAICFRSILRSALACLEERHLVDGPEAEVAALAVDGQAHGPALAPTLIDFKVEAATIRVPAWVGNVFDGGGREAMDALGIVRMHEMRVQLFRRVPRTSDFCDGDSKHSPHVVPHRSFGVEENPYVSGCLARWVTDARNHRKYSLLSGAEVRVCDGVRRYAILRSGGDGGIRTLDTPLQRITV